MWKDCLTFKIMGQTVYLYSEEMSYGRNTVADINNQMYYLGKREANVEGVIFAWEAVNGRSLTADERNQVLIDNHLMSEAI